MSSVLGMTGYKTIYDSGSTAMVLCYSNFTGASIHWLNMSSTVSFSTNQTTPNEVLLSINAITHSTHGTIFICEVRYQLPTGERRETKSFTIRTTEECKIAITVK